MNHSAPPVPTFDALLVPTVQALQTLGGSGTIEEIYEQVIQLLNLPDQILEIIHVNTSQSEVEYRLAWSRTYLKKYGLLENSARGVWSLTSTTINPDDLDPREVVRFVREVDKKNKASIDLPNQSTETTENLDESTWHQQLHEILLSLDPAAFERLAQRLLRESGFIQVQVTGKSGDGGIDGVGIARINGFLSFHVLFQCKRYQGSVTASQIRDFRGAMQGRTDKGLMITTGTFTRDAIKEATRDGAPPIDLIDGEQLVQRLKELGLGVKINLIESVDVDAEWFTKI
ncbi:MULTISPECIES: restriction endonuclease [Cyanophyceae]|uniref:restriction endonuclease n=1 Tax=Cyanophyceae TaxID=3028117 RepID=UPI00016DC582|nr:MULTISPECIES: restriction endonuclease [Cyanophyceae]ACA99004.1 restriction endonuclease, similarity to Mrr [Picosynechococcus sp. PCC 7002]SMH35868.1 restriction system protein [Picosynechococcus sp. OG1]SMQ84881.1 restriction system protein [Synechococcus sp. 7002]